MSGIVKAIVGAIAVPLAMGGGQLAPSQRLAESARDTIVTSQVAVNRLAKADRVAETVKSELPWHTVSVAFPDRARSVLMRLPIAGESGRGSESASQTEATDQKIGCESVVSALAEAFNRAQPGRCVT